MADIDACPDLSCQIGSSRSSQKKSFHGVIDSAPGERGVPSVYGVRDRRYQQPEFVGIHHSAVYEISCVVEIPLKATNDFGQKLSVRIVVEERNLANGINENMPVRGSFQRRDEIFRAGKLDIDIEAFFDLLDVPENDIVI